MPAMQVKQVWKAVLFACWIVFGLTHLPAAKADVIVTVDTSSIAGEQGFIDIQFNPGPSPVLAATATITGFTTDATLLASVNGTPAGFDGDASGTLPGTLTINNTFVLNDIFQPVAYGNTLSFDVAFSGPAVSSPDTADNGSSFGLTLYANDFATPLLSDGSPDSNGTVETISLNPDGSTTPESFFQPAGPSVPEPATWLLLAPGIVAAWVMRKRADSRTSTGIRA